MRHFFIVLELGLGNVDHGAVESAALFCWPLEGQAGEFMGMKKRLD